MQLNKNRKSIRISLQFATSTLLSCAGTSTALSAAETTGLDTQISQLYYSEEQRVTVNKFEVRGKKEIFDDSSLSIDLVYDSMTGASPNGRYYQGESTDTSVIPITTASGFSFTTTNTTSVAQKASWLSDFKDTRKAIAIDWEQTIARIFKATIGVSKSYENDYDSNGASANIGLDLFEKRTTLSLGASINDDTVSPVGGVPQGLGKLWCTETVSKQPSQSLTDCDTTPPKYKPADKLTYQYMAGVTQIWNARTLFQLNFSQQIWSGYLTDPYKQISVITPTDYTTAAGDVRQRMEEVGILYEKRPSDRTASSIFVKLVTVPFDPISINVSYRYFYDSWQITSHTADGRGRFDIGEKLYLQGHLRLNRQYQAAFYRPSFSLSDVLPNYASADHRLSDQDTVTVGAKVGYSIRESGGLAVRADYMYQRYRNQAIPNMKAWIVQFLMQTKF